MDLKEKIQLLVVLQEKDSRLDVLRGQAADIPEKIKAVTSRIDENRASAEDRKKNLQQIQLKRKQKEMEVEARENDIRKHTAELNAVKSNDAYKALLLEIEHGKKEKFNLENEILELMELADKEAASLKAGEQDTISKEGELKSEISRLEASLRAVQEQVSRMEQERTEYSRNIPDDIMHRYEFVRESRGGLAIVPIEGTHCGGCHMELRPQMINEARKHQDWIVCDSCSRILYYKE